MARTPTKKGGTAMKTVRRTVFTAVALVALSAWAFGAGSMGGYSDTTSGASHSTVGTDSSKGSSPGGASGSDTNSGGTSGYSGSGSDSGSYSGSGAGGSTSDTGVSGSES